MSLHVGVESCLMAFGDLERQRNARGALLVEQHLQCTERLMDMPQRQDQHDERILQCTERLSDIARRHDVHDQRILAIESNMVALGMRFDELERLASLGTVDARIMQTLAQVFRRRRGSSSSLSWASGPPYPPPPVVLLLRSPCSSCTVVLGS